MQNPPFPRSTILGTAGQRGGARSRRGVLHNAPGLDEEQLDELGRRVTGLLEEPWDKGTGRPRALTLREALVVTCGYLRQNITEDVWADIFDVDQSTISRYITLLTPFVETTTEEDRPA
jgi:hypothetical protein